MNGRDLSLVAMAGALSACASGPISGPAVAGAAAMLAVFDQLVASGTLSPEQHEALVQGMTELRRTVEVASSKPTLGPEETAGIAGGVTATVLALLRAWQSFKKRRAPAPPAS